MGRPSAKTLWHRLSRAVERSLVACAGTGRRGDLFRYWLLERMGEGLEEMPLADLAQPDAPSGRLQG